MFRNPVDPLRQDGPVFGAKRRAVEQRCAELDVELAELDAQIAELSRRRRRAAVELRRHRNRLRPSSRRGREPSPDGSERLPVLPADADWVSGRRLRAVCATLLSRLGPLPLTDLHAELHRHGYGVAHRHATKALADAMGYEADHGRAVRISRGVYATNVAKPKPLPRELHPKPVPGGGGAPHH